MSWTGAGNMAGVTKGASTLIRAIYPKALYFHCAAHKLNLCVAHSCKPTSISNMMSSISALSNFFNYSPGRQGCLEYFLSNYPNVEKGKLIPLCRTRWDVERLGALEVTLDLLEAVVDALTDMALNRERRWNRDTVAQASTLLKSVDYEFIINLVITQKVLAFTSSITTGLQQRGLDLVRAYEEIQLVIRTLQHTRNRVEEFHRECYIFCSSIASKLKLEAQKPRTCQRQRFRQDSTTSSQSIEDYF